MQTPEEVADTMAGIAATVRNLCDANSFGFVLIQISGEGDASRATNVREDEVDALFAVHGGHRHTSNPAKES